MMRTAKMYRQLWLVLPIVVSLGVIVYGGINYINKPIQIDNMKATIQQVFDHRAEGSESTESS